MLKNKSVTIAAILIAGIFGLFIFFDPLGVSLDVPAASHRSITHTVLFQFKQDASQDAIKEVSLKFRLRLPPSPPSRPAPSVPWIPAPEP